MEFIVGVVAVGCVAAFFMSEKLNFADQVVHYSDAEVDVYQWNRTGVSLTPEEIQTYKKTKSNASAIRGFSTVIFCFCLLYLFPQ